MFINLKPAIKFSFFFVLKNKLCLTLNNNYYYNFTLRHFRDQSIIFPSWFSRFFKLIYNSLFLNLFRSQFLRRFKNEWKQLLLAFFYAIDNFCFSYFLYLICFLNFIFVVRSGAKTRQKKKGHCHRKKS